MIRLERIIKHEPTWYALTQGFDDVQIEDVVIFPWAAFTGPIDREYEYPLDWGCDVINRVIPELGIEYINLFANCGVNLRHFFFFIDHVNKEDWNEGGKN